MFTALLRQVSNQEMQNAMLKLALWSLFLVVGLTMQLLSQLRPGNFLIDLGLIFLFAIVVFFWVILALRMIPGIDRGSALWLAVATVRVQGYALTAAAVVALITVDEISSVTWSVATDVTFQMRRVPCSHFTSSSIRVSVELSQHSTYMCFMRDSHGGEVLRIQTSMVDSGVALNSMAEVTFRRFNSLLFRQYAYTKTLKAVPL